MNTVAKKKKIGEGRRTISPLESSLSKKRMKWEKGSNMPCGSQKDKGNIKALQIRNKQGPDHRLLHLSRAAFEDDWNPTGTSLQD